MISFCTLPVHFSQRQKWKPQFVNSPNMAGDFVPESELNLKGWQKHFNSYTLRGRFNWVVATYGTIFGTVILYKLLKRKPIAAK